MIIKPYITEKTMLQIKNNIYSFVMPLNMNSVQAKKEISNEFKVDIINSNTITKKGKIKKFKNRFGKRNDNKIIFVKLKKGQTIKDFTIETPKEESKVQKDNNKEQK